MPKIGLFDIDSTIPNIALMRISSFYKKRGSEIVFNFPLAWNELDKKYISVIFPQNKKKAEALNLDGTAIIGGSGYSLKTILPSEIETEFPDYSLYPGSDYSLGFTSRGCIRRCPFCIVPQKEGKFRIVGDIYDFWDREHKIIKILDNNILADKDHFKKICGQIRKENLRVDFNQGLDYRLLDEEIIKEIKQTPSSERWWRFSWDNPKEDISEAIKLLKGIPCKWYILVGFNTTAQEDLQRIEFLRKNKHSAFVMKYKNNEIKSIPILTQLARWVNQPHIFWTRTFEEFLKEIKKESLLKFI